MMMDYLRFPSPIQISGAMCRMMLYSNFETTSDLTLFRMVWMPRRQHEAIDHLRSYNLPTEQSSSQNTISIKDTFDTSLRARERSANGEPFIELPFHGIVQEVRMIGETTSRICISIKPSPEDQWEALSEGRAEQTLSKEMDYVNIVLDTCKSTKRLLPLSIDKAAHALSKSVGRS